MIKIYQNIPTPELSPCYQARKSAAKDVDALLKELGF